MLKVVTLKRRAALSIADFQSHPRYTYGRWRQKAPSLRRYVQSCARPQG